MESERSNSLSEFPNPIYVNGYRVLTHIKNSDKIEIKEGSEFVKERPKNFQKWFVLLAFVVFLTFLISYKIFKVYFNANLKHSTPNGSFVWHGN